MGKIVKASLDANNGLVDSLGNLTAGALSRVSAATYVDPAGVLTDSWGDRDQMVITTEQDPDAFTGDWTTSSTGREAPAAYSWPITPNGVTLSNAIHFQNNGSDDLYAYAECDITQGNTYVFSFYIIMDDGSLPVQATNSTDTSGDFRISMDNVTLSAGSDDVTIESVGSNVYRVSYAQTSPTGGADRLHGIVQTDTQSDKHFRASGFMLEELPSGNVIGDDLFDQEALGSEETNQNNAVYDSYGEADATTGWAVSNATLVSQGTTKSTGSYGFEFTATGANGRAYELLGDFLTDGKIYKLSFDVRHAGDGSDSFYVQLGHGGSTVGNHLQQEITDSDTTFTTYNWYFIMLADGGNGVLETQYFMLWENGANNNAHGYIDNITIKEVTTPAKGEFTHPAILGSEAITAQNDRDFSSGTIGNWTLVNDSTDSTLTYDTTDLDGADDKQALITVDETTDPCSYAYAVLSTAQIGLTTNTLYKISAKVYVPSGNTLQDVKISDLSLSDNVPNALSFSPTTDTFEEISGYMYLASDIVGSIFIGFDGNPADGDLLYFDDVSIRPVQVSWAPYGTNTIEIDESENALKVTYVDNDAGASLILKNVTDLSADLVVGQEYLITFDYWVTTGDSFKMEIWGGGSEQVGITLDQDSSTSVEVVYTAQTTTSDFIRFDDMAATEAVWIDNLTIKAIPDLALLEPSDYVNSATVPAKPRFETEGLLIEGEATNLLEYSEDFSQWSKSNVKTPGGSVTDPTGATNTGLGLIADATANEARWITEVLTTEPPDNTVHTASVFLKAGTVSWAAIAVEQKDDSPATCYFDIANVALDSSPSGGEDYGIEEIGGGWVRAWVAVDSASGTTDMDVRVYAADAQDDVTIDATEDDVLIYVYGAQLEETPYPTSYIPTDGTQVTRTTEAGASGSSGYSWTMSQNLMDIIKDDVANGTMIITWTPGFDYGDGSGDMGGVSTNSGVYSLFYYDDAGRLPAYDSSTATFVDVNYTSGTEYIVVTRWHEVNADLVLSEKHGGSWTHDTVKVFDGEWVETGTLYLHYSNEYPAHYKNLIFYDTYLSDAQIESEPWDGGQAIIGGGLAGSIL